MSSSNVIGVVILARHGDREGFYQDPLTYTASATQITALGNVQEFQLGQQLRSMYINASSPTNIQSMNPVLFDQTQVQVQADGGGERGVIFDSSISVVQGLWPATSNYNSTLANGSTIAAPLGGYQYVPVASIDPNEDVSLEGYTSCNTFNNQTSAFYNSTAFKQVAAENAAFLNSLPPFLDGRSVSLENMFNIFDYMNVQSIHNETFAKNLPDGYLNRVRALANFHEYGVFSSPQVDGIGNIAGRTMLPAIIGGFQQIANASNPLKFVYEAIAYKPFLSLFNMTGVAQTYPELAGIVEYAAAVVYEVRPGATPSDPMIRMIFKNGTNDIYRTYNMFGQPGDIPLSMFTSQLEKASINTTAQWCITCANSQDRGCGTCDNAAMAALASQAANEHHSALSNAAAGVIGAAVTAAVIIIALTIFSMLGCVSFGRKRRQQSRPSSSENLKH